MSTFSFPRVFTYLNTECEYFCLWCFFPPTVTYHDLVCANYLPKIGFLFFFFFKINTVKHFFFTTNQQANKIKSHFECIRQQPAAGISVSHMLSADGQIGTSAVFPAGATAEPNRCSSDE